MPRTLTCAHTAPTVSLAQRYAPIESEGRPVSALSGESHSSVEALPSLYLEEKGLGCEVGASALVEAVMGMVPRVSNPVLPLALLPPVQHQTFVE